MRKSRKHTGGNVFALSTHRTNLRRLFVMFALLVVGITTMWAADITYNSNFTGTVTKKETINQYYHTLKSANELGWSRDGYQFVGWNTNRNATTAQYNAGQDIHAVITKNTTLYAIWIQVFTITVNNGNKGNITIKNNDTGSTISSGTAVPKGTSVTVSASAWDTNNNVFSQWSNNVKDNPYTFTANSNVNITAQWKQLYTLNVSANQGGSVSIKNNDTNEIITSGSKVPEGTSVTCTAAPDATYRFVRWDNGNTNNPYTFTVNTNINRTATLEKLPRLNITSSLPEISTITIEGVTKDWLQRWKTNGTTYQPGDYVSPGTNVRVTVTTAGGARFTWSDNNSNTTPRVIENIQSDVNLTANVVSDNIAPKFYDIKDGVRGAELQLVPGTTNSYRLTREYDTPGQKEYIFVERPNGEKNFNIQWIDRVPTNPYFDGNNGYRLQLDAPAYGEHRTLCFTVTSSSGAKTETYTINISTKPKAGSNFSMDMMMNTNATTFGYDKGNSTMTYTVNNIANTGRLDILDISTDYILKESDAKPDFTAMLGSKADWQEFNSQSLILSYDLPEGEKFTLNNIVVPIMAENTNSDICLQFIDSKGHKIEYKNGGNPIRQGMVWDYSLTNPGNIEFEGKISLLVYGYGNNSDGFRIGDKITMTGTLTRPAENEANTDLKQLTYDGIEIPVEYDDQDNILTEYSNVHSVSTYVPHVEAVAVDKFAHVDIIQPVKEEGSARIFVTSPNGSTQTYTVHFVASSKTPSSDLVWNTRGIDVKQFNDGTNDVKAVYATDDEGNVYRLTLNLQDDDDYKGERLFLSSHSGTDKLSLRGIDGNKVKGRIRVGETLACESYRIFQSGTSLPVASASAITSEEHFTTSAFTFIADKTYTFDFSNDVRISNISWSPIEEDEKLTHELTIITEGQGNKKVSAKVTDVLTNTSKSYEGSTNGTLKITVNEGDRVELTATGNGLFHQWKNNATNLTLHTQNPLVIENINRDFNLTAIYIKENDIDVLGLAQFNIGKVSTFGSNGTKSMSDGGNNTYKDILIDSPSAEVTSLGGNNGFKVATNGSFRITNQSDKNVGVNQADLVDVQIVTDEGLYKFTLDPSPTDAEISNYGNVWTYSFDSTNPREITIKNNTSRSIIIRGIYVHYKWNMPNMYNKENVQNPYFFGDPNVTTYVGEKNVPMPALTVLQMGDGHKVDNPNVTYSSSDESIVKIENGTISAVGVGSAVVIAQVRFRAGSTGLSDFNSYASFIVDSRELDDLNVDAENIMMYTTDQEVKQPVVVVSYKQDGIITQLKEGGDYSLQYEVIDAGQYESLAQSKIKGGSSITLKGTAGNWQSFTAAVVRVTVTPTESAKHTFHVGPTTADFNYTVTGPNTMLNAVMDKPNDIYVGLNEDFDVSRLITMRYNGIDVHSGTDVTNEFRFEYTFDNPYGAGQAGVSVDANGILKTSGSNFNATLVVKAYGIKNSDENRIRFNNSEWNPINLHVGPYKKYSMSPELTDISILKGDMESMPVINILKEDGSFESEEDFDLLIESSNESIVKLKDIGNLLPELQAVEKGKSIITVVVHAKSAGQYCDTQFSFTVNVVDGGGYRVQKDDVPEVGKDMEIKTLDGRVLCAAYLGGWTFKPGMQAGDMTFGDGTKNWSNAKKDLPLNSYYEYRFGGDDLNIPVNEDGTAAAPAAVANSNMLHNAFNVPVEGSYIVFTPKTRGTVKAYVYQHYVNSSSVAVVTSLNAKATISGTLMNAYSGTLKKSSNTYSINKAPGAMVCYSFDVLPGETYYLYNKNSKLSFYGYEFVEKAGLTTTKKTYNDTKANTVTATSSSAVSTATVSKTFKAGVWTSAMLPFSLNEKQIGEIFGPLYGRYNESSKNGECTQIVYFQRADINTGKLYFTRHAQNTISRGVPFLILPMHDATINTANIEDKNIYSAATYSSVKNDDGTTTKVPTQVRFGENEDFVWTASYDIQTINPGDYYFNTDGVVKRREVSPAKVRSLSGFLEAKTPEAQQAKLMSVVIGGFDDEDDDVTYIMEVGYDENGNFTMKPVQDGKVYDLNGQMVSESADNIDSLPTGIYIINGKKYTVK